MKKALCVILVIVSVCLLSYALADDTDKFLGKWICSRVIVDGKTIPIDSVNAELELAVRTDGTALVYMKQGYTVDRFEGAWLAEGNALAVTDGQSYMLFTMNTSGELLLSGDGFEFILVHQDTIQIDAEHFPDEKFRELVKHFDFTNDGLLNDEEIKCAREFDFAGREIADATGIGIFTNLETLTCYNNSLTRLDLSKNTKLKYLYCGQNKLTELNVSKCTKLIELSCSENPLKKLDVSKCKALKNLECDYNELTKLNVNSNKKLESLSCGHNQLTSINVSKNAKLIRLNANSNQLTSVDVSHNAALRFLSVEINKLTDIDVSHNTALNNLGIEGNKLTDIDLSHNPQLIGLDCSFNPLTRLDLSKNPEMTDLFCEGIGLTTLDVSGLTMLWRLKCKDNRLTALDLTANTKLEILDCSGNLLTNLNLRKNRQLTELYCTDNRLAALDLIKNGRVYAYSLACGGNCFPVTTKDGNILFTSLPGFSIKKATDIKFTADSGAKKAFKKTKTAFVVKESGVITYTYKINLAYTETFSIRVEFLKPEISTVTLKKKSYPYTGSPIEPTMVVKAKVDGKAVKLSASDYTVTYENNVDAGTATVIVEGQGSYGGRIEKTFTITPVKILKVELSKYELPYNGKGRKPVPTVTAKAGGQTVTLEKDKDYTVKYENNKQPGTATVTITGKGNYTGTIVKTFMIVEK